MRFSKYHGLGNDFIVVDLRDADPALVEAAQQPDAVRALCDRRFGVGADGVLPILPPVTGGAHARMRVLNADGGEAEMCGNGIRCVAKHLYERTGMVREAIVIDTGAGALTCRLALAPASGRVDTVTVDMGRPRLTRAEIPMTGPAGERCVEVPLSTGDRDLAITAVSMGNPHAVAFVDDHGPGLRRLAEGIGPAIERNGWFPNRTNVELAHVESPADIELVVWERGCGITLACGTGACATAVAACLTGRARPGEEIAIRLLGGPLAITVAPDYATVWMRGPASHVFDAELDLDAVAAQPRPAS